MAASGGARRTILTHLGSDYDYETMSRELPQGVELEYDGMRIDL